MRHKNLSIVEVLIENGTVQGTLSVAGATTLSGTVEVAGVLTPAGGVAGDVTGDLTGDVLAVDTAKVLDVGADQASSVITAGSIVGDLTGDILATAASAEHGIGSIGTAATPVTSRREENSFIVTEHKFDVTGLKSGAVGDSTIGIASTGAGGVAFIGRNILANNGVVTKVELICIETPAGGDDDINVVSNVSATLEQGDAGGTTYLSNSGDLLAGQRTENLVPAIPADHYFYLTAGSGDTAAVYTAGQYILRLYGHPLLT